MPSLPLSAWPLLAAFLLMEAFSQQELSNFAEGRLEKAPLGPIFPWLVVVAIGLLGSEILVRWLSQVGIQLRLQSSYQHGAWMLITVPICCFMLWLGMQLSLTAIGYISVESKFPDVWELKSALSVLSGFAAAYMLPILMIAEGLRHWLFKEKLETWRQLCIKRMQMPSYSENEE